MEPEVPELTEEEKAALELAKLQKLMEWSKACEKLRGFNMFTAEHMANVFASLPDAIQVHLSAIPSLAADLAKALATIPFPSSKTLAEDEMRIRREVVTLFYPDPKEGTNTALLNAGWELKYTHKLERKVDEATLDVIKQRLREEFQVNPDLLIKYTPEVATKEYKSLVTLNPEAAKVFESTLIIKVGSPSLELKAPKEK